MIIGLTSNTVKFQTTRKLASTEQFGW